MWRKKVNERIYELSKESYEQNNRLKNGRLRKKYVPYSVPPVSQELVKCLGQDDEERAKAILLEFDYLKQI